jgi:hypothetical protein
MENKDTIPTRENPKTRLAKNFAERRFEDIGKFLQHIFGKDSVKDEFATKFSETKSEIFAWIDAYDASEQVPSEETVAENIA